MRQTLKAAGVHGVALEQLNEHSDARDVQHFVSECRTKKVALVSDCGTPGFCDPGADLVKACVSAGIEVHAVPGASSLMTLLSICGERVDQFMATATTRIDTTLGVVQDVMSGPVRQGAVAMAAVRAAMAAFRDWQGRKAARTSRDHDEDDAWFVG